MRRTLCLLAIVGVAAALAVSISQARKSANKPGQKKPRPVSSYHTQGLSDLPLEHPSREKSITVEGTVLGDEYTFDTGGVADPQGWTSVDHTIKDQFYFHVDGSSGNMHSAGLLVPLEGGQSLWCGFPYLACSPGDSVGGYGNSWREYFESDTILVQGDVTVSYLISYDTEPGYDYAYLQYYDFNATDWVEVKTYNGQNYCMLDSVTVPSVDIGDSVKFRFRFYSDGAWSDEDCDYITDGAVIIDSLTIKDETGVIDFQDFESEALGATETDDNGYGVIWRATAHYFGDFATLHDGYTVLQEDPCHTEISSLWGFFADPAIANYYCDNPPHPEQGVIPYPDSEGLKISNSIQSPWIQFTGSGNSVVFEFDVYRDMMPAINPWLTGVFYSLEVRSWVAGSPTDWVSDGYMYYGKTKDWERWSKEIGNYIVSGAEKIQVAIRVFDICPSYGSDCSVCRGHGPLFDNVKLVRYDVQGPFWNVEDECLFQDNFSTNGTDKGSVRMDIAQDLLSGDFGAPITPGDSMAVTVYEPNLGIGTDANTGCGPAVYLHVKDILPDKSGSAIEAPEIRGVIPCGSSKRYPVVATIGGWTTVRFDSALNSSGIPPQADRYCVDLKDNLYTPGDTVYFYFSAIDAGGDTTYWSRYTGATDSEVEVQSAPMEMTCLPANGDGATNILYIDDFDQLGAQPYFNAAFEALGITPDRYDVRAAHLNVGNGPGSRVVNVVDQLIPHYNIIIWNSGNLEWGTIGDGVESEKSDDATMLYDFLHQHDDSAAVYFTGDNLGYEWAYLLTGSGAVSLRSYMDYTVLTDDHAGVGLPVSPLVVGQWGSIFYHSGDADSLVVFGGCPSMNEFDVLESTPNSSVAAAYENNSAYGAVLVQESSNGLGNKARVALSGFSYHEIRDVETGTPAYIEHLQDILNWFGLAGGYTSDCQVQPTSLDFETVFVGDYLEKTFTIKNNGGGTLSGTVTSDCPDYTIVSGDTYNLGPGQSNTVTVRYEPTDIGTYACTIETGLLDCPDVLCEAFASLPPICQIWPTSLDFDSVFVWSWKDTSLIITNAGGDTLRGTVSAPCPHYSIVSGGELYALGNDDSLTVTVRFEPAAEGSLFCTIETGDLICSDVSCTGVGEGPVCQIWPTSLNFDSVFVESWKDTSLIITNAGGDTLRGTVSAPCPHYSIISGGGPYALGNDDSLTVTVRFEPTVAGSLFCTIEMGDLICSDVSCTGVGEGPVCQIWPTSLNFDSVFVWSWKDTSLIITNAGGDTLRGTVSAPCPHYSIVSGGGPYALGNDDSLTVTVRFEPAAEGSLFCTIETGDAICSDISCTGVGESLPSCLVQPVSLDFDTVFVGSWKDTSFFITNTGGGMLTGSVGETCDHYSIQSGGGPYSLEAAETLRVAIRFEPAVEGSVFCTIETGDALCSDVSCTGVGNDFPACEVTPTSLDFGALAVGSTRDTMFKITNTGAGTLIGNVSETCDHFSIESGGGPYQLLHGDTITVTVRYNPTMTGSHQCTVETGVYLCGDVSLMGTAYSCGAGSILYVDEDASGLGDGSSWANAFTELRDALVSAASCPNVTEIWVAEGTYLPTEGTDRDVYFELQDSLAIYGGFAGTETMLSERDIAANVTVLSGDIGMPGTPADNSYHVVTGSGTDTTAVLDGFTVTGGTAYGVSGSDYYGGGMLNENSSPRVQNVTFVDNRALVGAGMANRSYSNPVVENVSFIANIASSGGGGVYNSGSNPTFRNVAFIDNSTTSNFGGGADNLNCNAVFTNVVFVGNSAARGGGLSNYQSDPTLTNASFSRNVALTFGGGIYNRINSEPVITNTIMWGDSAETGPEILCEGYEPTISYSLVQGCGGSGPGWDSSFGIDGGNNIDINPMYCSALSGDLRLRVGSPAIDAGDSTVPDLPATDLAGNPRIQDATVDMGAYEGGFVAMFEYAFIDSIVDVPDDQGGWVRIYFTRSIYDDSLETQYPIDQYDIYRWFDNPALVAELLSNGDQIAPGRLVMLSGQDDPHLAIQAPETGYRLFGYNSRYFIISDKVGTMAQTGAWEVIGNVSATQQDQYIFLAPTLADSAYTDFYISAHTTTPTVFFDSPVDSGYSVDNIAPGIPEGFEVAYNTGSGNHLTWDPSSDPDFQYFKIYRGTDPDFTPAPENLVDATAGTEWNDSEYDGWNVYYKISAVDHAGNESDVASPGTTSGVTEPKIPETFALYQNVPNPFNPTTSIRYDVPEGGGHVTLRVYDVSGRLVRTLIDGPQTAGGKFVTWNGRNNRGGPVATGVYFYRMTAPGFEMTKKMVLLQ